MAPIYSVEVAGTEDPDNGWGPIHRCVSGVEMSSAIYDRDSEQTVMTCYENFQNSRRKFGSRPFLGHRPMGPTGAAGPYVWSTYEEVGQRADNFGSGLASLELCPPTDDAEVHSRGLLGLYSKNRPEWVIAEQAAYTQAVVTVPMYDTLGPDSLAYVINQTSLKTVVCSADCLPSVLACKAQCPSLECVIQMEPVSDKQRGEAKSAGLEALSFAEVEEEGKANPVPHHPPDPQDIFTFCYTSGTTGDPKGVLLRHMSPVAVYCSLRPVLPIYGTDLHLSYLPLPHVFERIVQFCITHAGAAIGFYQGETLKILEDLQELRPTIFPSVPRLLNRIHDRLRAGVEEAGGMKLSLFQRAYSAKKAGLASGSVRHMLWDRLVFSKIKQRVGLDRVRCIVTGSAPIADHVLDFLRIVFGCSVQEGYGLSESMAMGTLTAPNDYIPGTIGGVVGVNEIRLQDVPDMGYLRTDQVHGRGEGAIPCHGRGEICLRGPNIFDGYYKMPDKTAEAIDTNGWFHTGDVGLWTPDGRLKIIDRKKNLFKLAQGEYVAPEKIENLHVQSRFVMQNYVHGDSLRTQLVCVVVVDPDGAAAWAKDNGSQKALPALCKDPAFKKAVLADLEAIAKREKLAGFEIVKAIHLEPTPWEPGTELLTPTFKLQRKKAQEHYQAQIDEMYASLEAPTSKL